MKPIHVWEFSYYSTDLQEHTECYYYTHSDDPYLSIQCFLEDEGEGTEYSVELEEVINQEEMERVHGEYSLVLDKVG